MPAAVPLPRDPRALVAEAVQLHRKGRLAEAEALYRRALRLAPKDPEALHFLGLIAHQRGDQRQAVELIARAIAADATVAAYHSNLGEAYRALGRLDTAIACYRRALALDPNLSAARYCLGTALLEAKADADAVPELEAAVAAEPTDAEAHLNLGSALAALDRPDEAIAHFERAVALRPDYAEAHFGLGLAFKAKEDSKAAFPHLARAAELAPHRAETHHEIGTMLAALNRPDQAVLAYRQAIALRPDMVEAILALAAVLRLQHRTDEAISTYERARAVDPDSIEPLNGIGHALLEIGRFEEARAWFAQALERAPRSAETHFNLGLSYQLQGRFEEATAWHEKALALEPDHAGAHYHLVMGRKFEARDERIEAIERVLALPSLTPAQRGALHFALAKAYDDLGDYDAAFRSYKAGNDLRKAEIRFDPADYTHYVDRLIASFTPALFAARRGTGCASELPVFIVGMPRSGTTLVEQILASHPAVHGAGELDYLRQMASALPERLGTAEPFPECVARLEAPIAAALGEEHLARLSARAHDALRIVDKMPNNFQRLGLIALILPNARLIHCVRDPLDTCLSCYFQEFAHGQPFAYDLQHLGRSYRDYQRLMAHWHETLPGRILDVPYEALIADQEGWSRRLVAFLGLDWDERCLAFHETERLVRTASFWQVRQPIYTSSVGRWRRYAKHLQPLMAALGIEGAAESAA